MRTTRRRLLAGTSALAAGAALGSRLTPVAAQDKTTIRWWHISTEEGLKAGFQAAADAYMAEHPDVQIDITVLEADHARRRRQMAGPLLLGLPRHS